MDVTKVKKPSKKSVKRKRFQRRCPMDKRLERALWYASKYIYRNRALIGYAEEYMAGYPNKTLNRRLKSILKQLDKIEEKYFEYNERRV